MTLSSNVPGHWRYFSEITYKGNFSVTSRQSLINRKAPKTRNRQMYFHKRYLLLKCFVKWVTLILINIINVFINNTTSKEHHIFRLDASVLKNESVEIFIN